MMRLGDLNPSNLGVDFPAARDFSCILYHIRSNIAIPILYFLIYLNFY